MKGGGCGGKRGEEGEGGGRLTCTTEWNSVNKCELTSSTALTLRRAHSLSVSPLRLILEILSSSYTSLMPVHTDPPAQL